jgi:hypothetical protein
MTGKRAFLVLLSLAACKSGGEDKPPSHPIMAMEDRVRSRIDRIELIVDDGDRRKKVIEIYEALERLVWEYKRGRACMNEQLTGFDSDEIPSEDEIRGVLALRKKADANLTKRYVSLQLELRKNLTPEEFKRIDALR